MMTPAIEPLTARRNARFDQEWEFTDNDDPFDLTGWTGAMQLRLYGAQPGSAKVDLGNVTSDAEGVWIREPTFGIVRVRIDQATLQSAYELLIGANEAGSAARLEYDLRMTTPTGAEEVWMAGEFILEAGVTI